LAGGRQLSTTEPISGLQGDDESDEAFDRSKYKVAPIPSFGERKRGGGIGPGGDGGIESLDGAGLGYTNFGARRN